MLNKVSRGLKKLRHLRQSITISGLGDEYFERECEAIMEVYAALARHAEGVSPFAIQSTGRHATLEFSSRVFTPKSEAPAMEWAVVGEDMDGNGFIRDIKASGVEYVYGDENVVYYGEEITKTDGSKK